MLLRYGRSVWRSGQGCFSAKTGPRASRRCVRCLRGPSGETWILRGRLLLPEAGLGRSEIVSLEWTEPWLNRTHQAFAALCWWGLPAEIRSLRGTPNYGPRQESSIAITRIIRFLATTSKRVTKYCNYKCSSSIPRHQYIDQNMRLAKNIHCPAYHDQPKDWLVSCLSCPWLPFWVLYFHQWTWWEYFMIRCWYSGYDGELVALKGTQAIFRVPLRKDLFIGWPSGKTIQPWGWYVMPLAD
jgi:hypothetical protein